MKVVIDTNSFLVSIPKRSEFRPIFDAIINGDIQLLITTEMLNEYAEVFEWKMNAVVAHNILEMLLQLDNVQRVEVYYRWHLINKDADDNKFVDCAVSGSANYIVSDDRHYNVLKDIDFPSVQVIKTEDFLKLLAQKLDQ